MDSGRDYRGSQHPLPKHNLTVASHRKAECNLSFPVAYSMQSHWVGEPFLTPAWPHRLCIRLATGNGQNYPIFFKHIDD